MILSLKISRNFRKYRKYHDIMIDLYIGIILSLTFYRAMHFSAKRGLAIACRLSVCLPGHLYGRIARSSLW